MKVNQYWEKELDSMDNLPLNYSMDKIDFPSEIANVYEISYKSLFDEIIYGWFIEPKNKQEYPLVLEYIGYMNHLESPLQFMHWLSIGCGVLVTDSRGQGGRTLDTAPYQTVEEESLMAKGFLDRDDFYLRRLYWDGLRLVELAQLLPKVNQDQIFIHGTSQGGGVGSFVNSVTPHPIRYGFFDVPSHANLSHRVANGTGSYQGIHEYLIRYPEKQPMILETLEYFDIKNVVSQIKNPVLVSVGNEDPICPKEDYYEAFINILSKKEWLLYERPGHGGGGLQHDEIILNYILNEIDGE